MDDDQTEFAVSGRDGFKSFPGKVTCDYFYHLPVAPSPQTPVIVSVHGISRNAVEHMMRLRDMADSCRAAIIAPYFSRSYFRGYQRLTCRSGARSDLALLEMLEDFARLSGINTGRILLVGFSGGAQFAHRFAMVHADRVNSCISVAAGWYSWPDETRPFPLGTGAAGMPPGMALHPEWESVPIHIMVGSKDNRPEPNLNSSREIVELQGAGRYERARRWAKAMRSHRSEVGGAPVTLETIAHLGHDFGKAVSRHRLDERLAQAFGLHDTPEELCA